MKTTMVALVALCCLLLQPVDADPVPVSDSSGTPAIDDGTPVILQRENVTWVVDEHHANVTAVYHLWNPTGSEIHLSVLLPFRERVPDDLSIRQDNVSVGYTRAADNLSFPAAARFSCSIPANGTSEVAATYSRWIAEVIHKVVTYRYECLYFAGPGRHWNGSIGEAKFTFKVAKDLYSYGLSGFNVTETTRYMVARTSYTNWTAGHDVTAVWYDVNPYGTALLIVVPTGVIVAAVLVIRAIRKKTGRSGPR